MSVELLYYTPNYPQLVERVTRECYDSHDKATDKSFKFLKGVLSKGHLSVLGVGNVVFRIKSDIVYYSARLHVAKTLMRMKEINNYIRWTECSDGWIVSMNMLTLTDILMEFDNYITRDIKDIVMGVPTLRWFFTYEDIELGDNIYYEKRKSELYHPTLLSEDYTSLKEAGLNKKELDIHATFTVEFTTDTDVATQTWRHSDMTGGSQMSFRYVDMANAKIRELVGVNEEDISKCLNDKNTPYNEESIKLSLNDLDSARKLLKKTYQMILEQFSNILSKGRAKEIARTVAPKFETRVIQCRPLRQWNHLFDLRCTVHAQKEARADIEPIKEIFELIVLCDSNKN